MTYDEAVAWLQVRDQASLVERCAPKVCDTCGSLEAGGHYCLLYGCTVRDANIMGCKEWSARVEECR